MQMTWDEYIAWYNADKVKKPARPPLRTQLADDGSFEHIYDEESDNDWQLPSPSKAQAPRKSAQARSKTTPSNSSASEIAVCPKTPLAPTPSHSIDDYDLALMFSQTPLQIASRIR
jgi:hypothetical protein